MHTQIQGGKDPRELPSEGELVLVPFEWPVAGSQSPG